jgi:localization factor PodJL
MRNAPDDAAPPMRSRVATRVKSALLAASIVAIIAGSFQLLGNIFDFSIFDTIESKIAANIDSDGADAEEGDSATVAAIPNDETASTSSVDAAMPAAPRSADVTIGLLSPQSLPSLTPAPPVGIQPAPLPPASSLLAPALSVPGPVATTPGGDVTGSVAHAPAKQAAPLQPPASDRLPANIGSPRLRNAALGGDAGAAYEVAMRFVEGRGVPANLEEGARWFERAASKGLTPAQFRYASMLEKGQGVKKDLTAAQKLYIAAASKGHAKAMHNLAVLYAEGAEGKPDYASAAQWFRKAAEHGVADSQYNFGVLAARGLGTDRNIAESYKWFALAAAQGDKEAARKRDEVAAHLDAQTLASVQQAVKNFTPAPQPAEAIQITAPPGGWDRVTHPAQEKQRAAGPVSIGVFGSGKL